jgi:general L-amino acid transport system substrate-binding protein
MPFGNVTAKGPKPASGSTLAKIISRGYLKCGVSKLYVFADFNNVTNQWSGFDVEFCRAVAAAIFAGNSSAVTFTDLSSTVRFPALQNGTVDVMSRFTTDTFARDVNEPSANVGFSFTLPNFYDATLFGGIPS